jgi:hypothetical protein
VEVKVPMVAIVVFLFAVSGHSIVASHEKPFVKPDF